MAEPEKQAVATGQGVTAEPPPPYTTGYGAIPPQDQAAPYPHQGQPGYPPPVAAGAPPYGQYPPDAKQGPPPVVAVGQVGQPQVGTTTTTVITTQPVVAGPGVYRLGPLPVNVICWKCHANVVTRTSYSDGAMTWLLAGGICLVGGWLGCCLIPFCMTGTKDVTHACPNCHCVLGKYNRL